MVAGSMKHLVEVEPAKEAAGGAPSAGPTYRCAAGGNAASPPAVPGLDCCWDIFRYVRRPFSAAARACRDPPHPSSVLLSLFLPASVGVQIDLFYSPRGIRNARLSNLWIALTTYTNPPQFARC
jgi:hypothetical protein